MGKGKSKKKRAVEKARENARDVLAAFGQLAEAMGMVPPASDDPVTAAAVDAGMLPEHLRDESARRWLHMAMHFTGEPWLTASTTPMTEDVIDGLRKGGEAKVPDHLGPFWLFLHPEPGSGTHDLIIRGPFATFAESEAEGMRWGLSVMSQKGKAVRA